MQSGENVLAVELADGWYAGQIGFLGRELYGTSPELLAELRIELNDGDRAVIATDGRWRVGTGGRRATDLLMGEVVDATLIPAGWTEPGFVDTSWESARQTPGTRARLVAPSAPPVRVLDQLPALRRSEPVPGTWIYDVGQNLAGWARLVLRGERGTRVTVRFAEVLDEDGGLYTANLRTARATDEFVLAGGEEEVLEPVFTFHGFRYVEVTGPDGPLPLDAVTAVVCGTDLPPAGTFRCSDDAVNRLQDNIAWSQRGNFLEVPTDCPQRDERLGWTGDAQVFAATAVFNADVASFLSRWLVDLVSGQSADGAFPTVAPRLTGPNSDEADGAPGWGDAGVIVPWLLYVRYGDQRLLERCFPAMLAWVEHIRRANPDLRWRVRPSRGHGRLALDRGRQPEGGRGHQLLRPRRHDRCRCGGGTRSSPRRAPSTVRWPPPSGWPIAPRTSTPTAASPATPRPCTRLPCASACSTHGTAMAAVRHLIADIEQRGDHLSTGFLGVGHLLPALSAAGHTDVAYRLLHQDDYPSWLYPVLHGATTIWERWDGWTEDRGFQDPAMNSFNHYAFGSVGEWLYETVAGIRPDPAHPGFERVLLAPEPGGRLTWAAATHQTIRGEIGLRWALDGRWLAVEVSLPPGCSGELRLPTDAGPTIHEVASGTHHFRSTVSAM